MYTSQGRALRETGSLVAKPCRTYITYINMIRRFSASLRSPAGLRRLSSSSYPHAKYGSDGAQLQDNMEPSAKQLAYAEALALQVCGPIHSWMARATPPR